MLVTVTQLWSLGSPGERPWAGLRQAQIVATKIRGQPTGELQWPPGSNKTIKVIAALLAQSEELEKLAILSYWQAQSLTDRVFLDCAADCCKM